MKDGSILVVYWKDFFVGEVDENHEREVLERRQECALWWVDGGFESCIGRNGYEVRGSLKPEGSQQFAMEI